MSSCCVRCVYVSRKPPVNRSRAAATSRSTVSDRNVSTATVESLAAETDSLRATSMSRIDESFHFSKPAAIASSNARPGSKP